MKKWLLLCFLPLLLLSCHKNEENENILTGIYAPVLEEAYDGVICTNEGYLAVEYMDNTNTVAVWNGEVEPQEYCNLLTLDCDGNVIKTTPVELDLTEFNRHQLAGVGENGVYIFNDEAFWVVDWDGSVRGSVPLTELSLNWSKVYNAQILENEEQILVCNGKSVYVIEPNMTDIEQWSVSSSIRDAVVENDTLWLMTYSDNGNSYALEKWHDGTMLESYDVHPDVTQQWHGGGLMIACEDGWLYGWKSSIGVFKWDYTNVDNELITVLDLMASGYNGRTVADIEKVPGKDAYQITTTTKTDAYANFGTTSYHRQFLEKAPDKDLSEMTVLHLVCYDSDEETQNAVLRFNREHEDAYIRITTYSHYGLSDGMSGQDRMDLDLSTGVVHADILIDSSIIPLMNLYPFMTGTVLPEDIAQCVKNSYEVDGKLTKIGTNIIFHSRIGKRENFDGIEGWDLEQFLDYVDNLDEDEYMMEYISQDTVEWLLGSDVYSAFYTKTKANFDSELYIRLLNYIATLPTEPDEIMEHGVDNREQLAAGDFEGEFQLQYESAGENLYQTGKLKLYNNEYGTGHSFWNLTYLLTYCEDFYTTDIALPGFPVPEGNGVEVAYNGNAYAIPESCINPTLAWEFIESILVDSTELPPDDSYAYENLNFQFTTLTKPFEEYMEKLAGCQVRFSEKGMWKGYDLELLENTTIESLSDYIIPLIQKLYETAGYQNTVTRDVRNIINEEQSRFLSGAVTAEVCANATQSRVQLYLDENS